MENDYTEDRLYWAAVKRFTMMLEADVDLEPRLADAIIKFLDNNKISPADIAGLPADDPAAVRAAQLAASKKKS